MKIIAYIAHPIGGDVAGNLKLIDAIVRQINLEEPETVPFVPYYSDVAGAMKDSVPSERERGFKNNMEFFRRHIIDEVRLYGDRISPGMWLEIEEANKEGIPVRAMNKITYKILQYGI